MAGIPNEIYDEAMGRWIEQKQNHPHGSVSGPFEFDEDGGYYYSEYTRDDDEAVLRYKYQNPLQVSTTLSHGYISLPYVIEPTEMIREVSEIVQELVKERSGERPE